MKPILIPALFALVIVGCQQSSAQTQGQANVPKPWDSYVGSYEMILDPVELRDFKENNLPLPKLEVKADGTWVLTVLDERQTGTMEGKDGALVLTVVRVNEAPLKKDPEKKSSLAVVNTEKKDLLMYDGVNDAEYRFRRLVEGAAVTPEKDQDSKETSSAP